MPNNRKVKGIGSDLLRCSSSAPKDQTSDRNVTLEPSIKAAPMLVYHLYQKEIKKRRVEEREEGDRIREQ